MKYIVTITQAAPTKRFVDDVVSHSIVVDSIPDALTLITDAYVNWTVFLSITIVPVADPIQTEKD